MSELDNLMSLDPMRMSDQDIDKIITYHRQQRENFEKGIKPKKEKGPSVSLDSVVQALQIKVPPKADENFKRRV